MSNDICLAVWKIDNVPGNTAIDIPKMYAQNIIRYQFPFHFSYETNAIQINRHFCGNIFAGLFLMNWMVFANGF